MPLTTCEMRWLFDGPLPEEVERWFQSRGDAIAPMWREDRYLILPGVADMGIKQREGRVDIKGRLSVLGPHAIAPEAEGVAERWCKWTYAAAAVERLGRFEDGVIVVSKGRAQRHFLLDPDGGTQRTAQRDLKQRGLSLELTRIRVAGGEHWSLGVEAAPDDPDLLANLLHALGEMLRGFPMPLPRARSMSYPEWLARLGLDR
jgi:hypothetical protein